MKRRFQVNGSIYEIPEDKVQGFLSSNPKATEVKNYNLNGSEYEIPLDKVDAFETAKGLKKKVGGQTSLPSAPSSSVPSVSEVQSTYDKVPFINDNPQYTKYADSILSKNENKNFVQRYLYPDKYPRLQTNKIEGSDENGKPYSDQPDSEYSTHLMSYDPKSKMVYPEIVQLPNGKLKHLSGDKAWDYADKTGEYIQFPTAEEAKKFADNGYKRGNQYINPNNTQTVQPTVNSGNPEIDDALNAYQSKPQLESDTSLMQSDAAKGQQMQLQEKENEKQKVIQAAINTAQVYAKNNPKQFNLTGKPNVKRFSLGQEDEDKFSLAALQKMTPFQRKVGELLNAHDEGKLTTYTDSEGKEKLAYPEGALGNFIGGFKESWNELGEDRKLINAPKDEKLKILNEKIPDNQYLPTKPNPESISYGVGSSVLPVGKAALAGLVGATATVAVPEVSGFSTAGLPLLMAWGFSAPDMAEHSQAQALKQYYNRAKQENPNISDDEALKMAENASIGAYASGLAEGTAMNMIGAGSVPKAAGQGFWNALGQFAKNQPKAIASMAGISAGGAAIKDIGAKASGFDVKDIETLRNQFEAGKSGATMQLAFSVAHGLIAVPKFVKAQANKVLENISPEQLNKLQEAAIVDGLITEDQVNQTNQNLNDFKQAGNKMISTGDTEKDAVIQGLIQKKIQLEKMKTNLDVSEHGTIDNSIENLDRRIELAKSSDNPIKYAETDDLLGNKHFETKSFDQLSAKEKDGVVIPEDYGKVDTEEVPTKEGEEKKYRAKAIVKEKKGGFELSHELETGDKTYSDKTKAKEAAQRALAQHYYENAMDENLKPERKVTVIKPEENIPNVEEKSQAEKPISEAMGGGATNNESLPAEEKGVTETKPIENIQGAKEKLGEKSLQEVNGLPSGYGKVGVNKDKKGDYYSFYEVNGKGGQISGNLGGPYDTYEEARADGERLMRREYLKQNPNAALPPPKENIQSQQQNIGGQNAIPIGSSTEVPLGEASGNSSTMGARIPESGEVTGTQIKPTEESGNGEIPPSDGKSKVGIHVEYPKTVLSHKGLQETANEFGLENVSKRTRKSDIQLRKDAENTISNWKKSGSYSKNIESIISDAENKKVITDEERVILEQHLADIKGKLRSIKDINSPEFDKTLKEIDRIKTAGSITRSEAGATLRLPIGGSISGEPYSDFMSDELTSNNGADLTSKQKEIAIKDFNEYQEAETKYSEAISKLDDKATEAKAETEIIKKTKSTSKIKKTHEDFVAERQSAKDKIKAAKEAHEAKLKEQGIQQMGASPFVLTKEMIAPIKDLVSSYVEEGVTKLAYVTKKVYDEIKDLLPEVTERHIHDIIAGEYNEKKPTKTEVAIQKENLRIEAALINKLERLLNGTEPKTEKGKQQRNQEINELQSKIKDWHKENPDREAQLKSIKAKNEAETKRIQEKIDKGDYEPDVKKTPLLEQKELKEKFPDLYKQAVASKDALIKKKHEISIRRAEQMYKNRTPQQKAWDVIAKTSNVPRTLMASMDFSAPLRQGIIATIAHPKIAKEAAQFMFKAAGNEAEYNRWLEDVHNSPLWEWADKSKLAVTDPTTLKIKDTEEAYLGSQYAEQIPLAGGLVKASERAYVGYLNKLRWDLFKMYSEQFVKNGKTFENNPELYKSLASFVNAMTGRGNMTEALEKFSPALNTFLFAPRLIASRLNALGLTDLPNLLFQGGRYLVKGATLGKYDPHWGLDYGFYTKLPKELRVEAAKDMLKFVATGLTTLALIKGASKLTNGNIEVEYDPRSSDFGKIKVGNTRWDIWGGFQPYARLVAQIISGQYKSTGDKKVRELDAKGAFGRTEGSQLGTFLRGKVSPIIGTGIDIASHETISGEKVNRTFDIPFFNTTPNGQTTLTEELGKNLVPLLASDIYSAMQDQGIKGLFTAGVPSVFGVGVQTYQPKPHK